MPATVDEKRIEALLKYSTENADKPSGTEALLKAIKIGKDKPQAVEEYLLKHPMHRQDKPAQQEMTHTVQPKPTSSAPEVKPTPVDLLKPNPTVRIDQQFDCLQHKMQEMIKTVRPTLNAKTGRKELSFDMPKDTTDQEHMIMYRILMGAAANEYGATILASRPQEFTITLGDPGGDLDATGAQRNLQNRVDTMFNTVKSATVFNEFKDAANEQKARLESGPSATNAVDTPAEAQRQASNSSPFNPDPAAKLRNLTRDE